jgi:hypothetical protein
VADEVVNVVVDAVPATTVTVVAAEVLVRYGELPA